MPRLNRATALMYKVPHYQLIYAVKYLFIYHGHIRSEKSTLALSPMKLFDAGKVCYNDAASRCAHLQFLNRSSMQSKVVTKVKIC